MGKADLNNGQPSSFVSAAIVSCVKNEICSIPLPDVISQLYLETILKSNLSICAGEGRGERDTEKERR